MKRIALALAVFVSLMIPTISHAEWMEIGTVRGNTFFVDSKVRKHDGHIYFWELIDYLRPFKDGVLSVKTYIEGDCGRFRVRYLQGSFHKQPMGRGAPSSGGQLDNTWEYSPPGSARAAVLAKACKLAD